MKFLKAFSLVFISSVSLAQPLVFMESSDIVIGENAEVFVDGAVLLNTNGILSIEGSLITTGDFISQGNLAVTGNIQVKGDLSLLGNSSNFSQNSQVHLNGGNQTVYANVSPSLGELYCVGQAVKSLETDIGVQRLILDSSILQTKRNVLNINDNDVSSVSYSSGWVQSDSSGALSRNMQANGTYDFPVGDAMERLLVRITPSVDGNSGVRYAGVDANEDGLYRFQVEPSICSLSDEAYVQLYNVGGSESTVELRFPNILYDSFPVLCEREPIDFQQWEPLLDVELIIGNEFAVYEVVPTKNDAALILGRLRPSTPQIVGTEEACQGDDGLVYEALDSQGNDLVWNVGGGLIVSEQDSTIEVNWLLNQSGLISVVSNDSFGCSSLPAETSVVLHLLPEANFLITEPELPFELEFFTLESQSIGGASLQWEISNGETYNISPLDIRFNEPGIYEVLLTVTSSEGCIDTAMQNIEIIEGFIFSNVFSPNGDGINDVLKLPNSGLLDYSLVVFTRWGNEVFSSDFSKEAWDGRDYSGNLVPPGTYFYILKAKSQSKDYSKQGSLQIYY